MNASTISVNFSGTIDTRNARYRNSDGSITHYPNVDRLYGPYDSKDEAWEKLSEANSIGNNALVVGKTVGVWEDSVLREYWFEKACASKDDLVYKTGTEIEISLDPEGEAYTKVESIRMYNKIKNAPPASKFVGIDSDGNRYDLETFLNDRQCVIMYVDGYTKQRIDIDTVSYTVTRSFVEYSD